MQVSKTNAENCAQRSCPWCCIESKALREHMQSCRVRDVRRTEQDVTHWLKYSSWIADAKRADDFAAQVAIVGEMAALVHRTPDERLTSITSPRKAPPNGKAPVGEAVVDEMIHQGIHASLQRQAPERAEDVDADESPTASYYYVLKDFDRVLTVEEHHAADAARKSRHEARDSAVIAARIGTASVSHASLQTLQPGRWLGDEVINFFMELLDRGETQRAGSAAPNIKFVSTALATKWRAVVNTAHAAEVHRYSRANGRRKHPWLNSRFIFVPMNVADGTHWIAAIIDCSANVIYVCDSMVSSDAVEYRHVHDVRELVKFIKCDAEYHDHPKRRRLCEDSWDIVVKDLGAGSQRNAFDCGMFVISFARAFFEDGTIPEGSVHNFKFSGDMMQHRRSVALVEILEYRLQSARFEADVHDITKVVDVSSPGSTFYERGAQLPFVQIGTTRLVVYQPFVLVLMTVTQGRYLWKWGHGQGVQMDSTFACTKQRFSTFTLLVHHPLGFYVPGAVFITSDERKETISYALRCIRSALSDEKYDWDGVTEWKPAAFVTDCSQAESLAISSTFGDDVDIFWCCWHVGEAWKKHQTGAREPWREVNKLLTTLRDAVHATDAAIGLENWDKTYHRLKERCLSGEPKLQTFLKYFDKYWLPTRARWAKQFRSNVVYGKDTTGSVESWHSALKQNLRETKRSINSRRIDWFMWYLYNVVIPHYDDKVASADARRHGRLEHENTVETMRLVGLAKTMKITCRYSPLHYTQTNRPGVSTSVIDSTGVHKFAMNAGVEPCQGAVVRVHVGDEIETHCVSGLDRIERCAALRSHADVKCNCRLGQNRLLCVAKVRAMLRLYEHDEGLVLRALGMNVKDEVGSEPAEPVIEDAGPGSPAGTQAPRSNGLRDDDAEDERTVLMKEIVRLYGELDPIELQQHGQASLELMKSELATLKSMKKSREVHAVDVRLAGLMHSSEGETQVTLPTQSRPSGDAHVNALSRRKSESEKARSRTAKMDAAGRSAHV